MNIPSTSSRKHPRNTPSSLCLLLLLFVLQAGCSSFNSEWRDAAGMPVGPQGGIAGRWEGTWLSSSNGHTGKLRCIVSPLGNDAYEFHYHATFWKLFAYSYRADFTAAKTNGLYVIGGEKDLGWWAGGVYHHQGTATTTNMDSTYRSSADAGTFRLQRPSAGAK